MNAKLFNIFRILFFLFAGLTALVVLVWAMYIRPFFSASSLSAKTFVTEVKKGFSSIPKQQNGRVNILVLGTDAVEGRSDSGVLTDTIILFSLDLKTAKGTLIAVPRDLWLADEKTKINAMYFYGKPKYPDRPEQYTAEAVEKVLGLPVHYAVVMNLKTVSEAIDALGGVEIDVPKAFTDTQYPREGVDVAVERDPAKLYETVSFSQGKQRMDGKTALIYMRSRHSTDLEEGTDDARSQRQQDVLFAAITAVKREVEGRDTLALGRLFRVYLEHFSKQLPLADLIAMGKALGIRIASFRLVQYPILPLLIHPPAAKYKQWVYEPKDTTWKEIHLAVQEALSGTISE